MAKALQTQYVASELGQLASYMARNGATGGATGAALLGGLTYAGKEGLKAAGRKVGEFRDELDFQVVSQLTGIDERVTAALNQNPATRGVVDLDKLLSRPWEVLLGRTPAKQQEYRQEVQQPQDPHKYANQYEQAFGDLVTSYVLTGAIVIGAALGSARGALNGVRNYFKDRRVRIMEGKQSAMQARMDELEERLNNGGEVPK